MGKTTKYEIPYPEPEDLADIPKDVKTIVEKIEETIQTIDTAIQKVLNNKVDKEEGKGLSTNDYTNEDKAKLIPTGGTTGQVLAKKSDENNDVEWVNQTGGGSATDIINKIYPIGSVYISVNSANPSTLFGGEWEQIKDKFILACGDNYAGSTEGGNSMITLANENIPSHSHTIPQLSGWTSESGSHTHTGRYSQIGTSGSLLALRRISDEDSYKGEAQVTNSAGNHSHSITTNASTTGNTGSTKAFSIMPPYMTFYVWKRIA